MFVIVLQGFSLSIDSICITEVCAARTSTLFAHVDPTLIPRLACTRLVCKHIDRTNIARVARMRTARSHLASYLAHTLHHCSNTTGITVSHTCRPARACSSPEVSNESVIFRVCGYARTDTDVHMEEYARTQTYTWKSTHAFVCT